MNRMRGELFESCLLAAEGPRDIYNLTAPTGSGKTLSMLAFALRHAVLNNMRRIVLVIPYLTIIEQTAKEYKKLFRERFGENYILEHHSLARGGVERKDDDEQERIARLIAENWDAPIVITTSVQMLESLFANRPGACRKLHRLADSVIMFDEVQTFPRTLAIPTLATLSRLVERHGSTVLFATATQPAFDHLDQEKPAPDRWNIREDENRGWRPRHIHVPVPESVKRRTSLHWPEMGQKTPWPELAEQLREHDQALCVVNLKRHALELLNQLKDRDRESLFHLSTNLCPAHRETVLRDVRQRLDSGKPCRLIATQCIEAGVDVDFPVVWRAWAPLDSIAQAAGRCNRHGLRESANVYIFLPDDEKGNYPSGDYQQAAGVTRLVFEKLGVEGMNISDNSVFDEYYRSLYDLSDIANPQGKAKELRDAILRQDYQAVSANYRIIDQNTISVLVAYDSDKFQEIAEEARHTGLTGNWIRRAQSHCVNIYRPAMDSSLWSYLDPIPLTAKESARRNMEKSEEWFICLREDFYEREILGFVPPEDLNALIG